MVVPDRLGPYTLGAVHTADCIEGMRALPDGCISHIITDPPYSEQTHRQAAARPDEFPDGQVRQTDLGFEHLSDELREAAAEQFARLVRRWVLVFCDSEGVDGWIRSLTKYGLRHVRVGAWWKRGATPSFHGRYPASWHESIEMAHTGEALRWNGGGKGAVYEHPIVSTQGGDRVHPTQKPVPLMVELVRDFTEEGEIILDPFAGSGSTGIACRKLKRLFVGFERNPEWTEAANRRIEMDVERAGELTASTAPPGKQIGMDYSGEGA